MITQKQAQAHTPVTEKYMEEVGDDGREEEQERRTMGGEAGEVGVGRAGGEEKMKMRRRRGGGGMEREGRE